VQLRVLISSSLRAVDVTGIKVLHGVVALYGDKAALMNRVGVGPSGSKVAEVRRMCRIGPEETPDGDRR
jgi:hypothetical protein